MDRQLFILAAEVNACAESARGLVLREGHCRPADVAGAKSREQRRMRRMLLAWYGLREESEAPYRDARMLLTSRILYQAGEIHSLFDGTGVSCSTPGAAECMLDVGAVHAAQLVAVLYPSLAAAMSERDRIAKIRTAIESAASSEKRTPWKLISSVWGGIEKRNPASEQWRKDWHKHQDLFRP